jgi:hypothetical protein
MGSHNSRPPAANLAQRTAPGADAAQIADAFVSRWQEMDTALRPIIGRGGVTALYARGLYLTASARPWLAAAHKPVQGAVDISALREALALQSSAHAIDGSQALLQTFYELLTTLVGRSLTDQLLGSVWAQSLSGLPAQDPSP